MEKHFVSSKKKRCSDDGGDSCDDSCDDSDDDVDSDSSNSSRVKVSGSRVKIKRKPEDVDGSCGDGMDDVNCDQWLEEDWNAGTETGPDCEYSLMVCDTHLRYYEFAMTPKDRVQGTNKIFSIKTETHFVRVLKIDPLPRRKFECNIIILLINK